jgi:O-succinylbenzoic acid--CoA ligase
VEDWLRRAAIDRPDHPFLIHPDGSVTTFDEMEQRVQAIVGALRSLGLGAGDLVGVAPHNDVISVARLFAIPRTGAASLILNARLTPQDIAERLAQAGAAAAFDGLAGLSDPGDDGAHDQSIVLGGDRDHSILFTSGSTGRPKAVRLTWGNLEASAAASATVLEHTASDRWYAALPLFHVGGLSILIRSAREQSTVYLERSFDPRRAARLLLDGDATLGSLVASMLRQILDVEAGPFRGVKALLLGGGPSPLDLLAEATDAGLGVLPTYGMTETASQIATRPLSDALHPGFSAVPVPGAQLRIGVGGVIEVDGPMVSPGYLGEPERQGWFRTSDVGELVDGRLRVLGRADDVIITGGENVHPAEVERIMSGLDGVRAVVVVGVPSERWGEEVVAVVEGDVAPGALDRHARYHLAGFKVPKRWVLVPSIPMSGIGKPDRTAARALAADQS